MKQHQDNRGGHLQDHESTPNHCHKQLLMGWEWSNYKTAREQQHHHETK
jgi:hypothetical protein